MDRKALALRLGSAAVLVPAVLLVIYQGGWWFAGLMALVGWIMSYEWNRMCGGKIDAMLAVYVLTIGALGSLAMTKGIALAAVALAVGLALTAAVALLMRRPFAWAVTGLAYIGIPVMALIWLRMLPSTPIPVPSSGFGLVLWVFLVVWATDSGAFFAGTAFGGPRLAPTVSPNKTWSGALGGLVAASLIGLGFGLVAGLPIATAMIASAFVGLWAELGDLQESWFKRRLHIKDTGNLIPGHGGLLDRLDSLLFAAPVVCLMIVLPSRHWLAW